MRLVTTCWLCLLMASWSFGQELPAPNLPPRPPDSHLDYFASPEDEERYVAPEVVETPPRVLTLKEAEELALSQHPVLAQLAARIEAAEGRWQQAGLWPNPEVGFSADEMGDNGSAGRQGAYLRQRIVTNHKLARARAVAEQEIALAEQELAARRLQVLTDVRSGFYDVQIAQRRIEISRLLVELGDAAATAARQLLHARETRRVDLLQAEIEAERARIDHEQSENVHRAAWRSWAAVLGSPDMPIQRLEGDIEETLEVLTWNKTLARLLYESPQISIAAAAADRADFAVAQARAAAVPNVDVALAVHRDTTDGDTLTSVQVGMPLPIFDRNQGAIRQAEAELVAAERNLDRVQLALTQRLAKVFRQYEDARLKVDRYSHQILPKAEETFRLVGEAYKSGEINYLDLLTSQRTLFQTNLAYLTALGELWRARIRMEGLLQEGSLEAPH